MDTQGGERRRKRSLGRKEGPGEGNHTEQQHPDTRRERSPVSIPLLPSPSCLEGSYGNKGQGALVTVRILWSRCFHVGKSLLPRCRNIPLPTQHGDSRCTPVRMPRGLCTGRGEPAVRSPALLPAGKSGSEGECDAGRPGPFWALLMPGSFHGECF